MLRENKVTPRQEKRYAFTEKRRSKRKEKGR